MPNNDIKKPFMKLFDNMGNTKTETIRMDLIGIFVTISLSTELFKRNEDLKPFIDEIFMDFIDETMPDYLYKSRTQLIGRAVRVISSLESESLVTLYNRIIKYKYNTLKVISEQTKQERNDNDFLDYWSDVINNIKI